MTCETLEDRVVPAADLLAVGSAPGLPARAALIDPATGAEVLALTPFGADFTGGVNVALADLTGDGTPDLAAAPRGGRDAEVKIFDGVDGTEVATFAAFAGFTGEVRVAAGEVAEGEIGLAVAAGPGGGPAVRLLDSAGRAVREFLAYDESFTGGVEVALGQTPAGTPAVVTAAASNGGPHVKVFDAATAAEAYGFFAYDASFTGGVRLSTADINEDGLTDIVTGAGEGGAAHVRAFSGADGSEVVGFFADDPSGRAGVNVAAVGGSSPALMTSSGPSVKSFDPAAAAGEPEPEPEAEYGDFGWAGGGMAMSGYSSWDEVFVSVSGSGDAYEGGAAGYFEIERDNNETDGLDVYFTLSGVADPTDYVAGNARQETFGSKTYWVTTYYDGDYETQVSITAVDDTVIEPTESLTLTLHLNPDEGTEAYEIEPIESDTLSIHDNDGQTVWVVAEDKDASEEGPQVGTFTVHRRGGDGAGLVVPLTLTGTAVEGADYTATETDEVIFGPGEDAVTVTVTPDDDAEAEGQETVLLTLADGPDYDIEGGDGSDVVRIADNDIDLSASAESWLADEAGSRGPLEFRVRRDGLRAGDLPVQFRLSGEADAADYAVTASGEVSGLTDLGGGLWSAVAAGGAAAFSVYLTPTDDGAAEAAESAAFELVERPDYAVTGTGAEGVITDGRVAGVWAEKEIDAAEWGPHGRAVFRRLEAGPELTVAFTLGGYAVPGEDYTLPSAGSRSWRLTRSQTSLDHANSCYLHSNFPSQVQRYG